MHAHGVVMIEVQRIYERKMVEHLWPRGIRKEALHFSKWLEDVAPSDGLRRWFQHDASKWPEFRQRYRTELDMRPEFWASIVTAARAGDVILLYYSHDTEHNNAVVLRDYINEKLDQPPVSPPATAGAIAAFDLGY